MAQVSCYLNFPGTCEEAFNFYKTVFGTEFSHPLTRFGESGTGAPDSVKDKIMHAALPILGGFTIMGTDAPAEMGFTVTAGNSIYINLEPDTRSETERLFNALREGGKVEMELGVQFWGGYFGSLTDRFGIQWMFNCTASE